MTTQVTNHIDPVVQRCDWCQRYPVGQTLTGERHNHGKLCWGCSLEVHRQHPERDDFLACYLGNQEPARPHVTERTYLTVGKTESLYDPA